jgi:ComF family protein
MKKQFKNLFLELFFPRFCFGCQKEGSYLCQDCQALLEISGYHQTFKTKYLHDLYFALDYKSQLLKNLVQKYKYEPFVKDLAQTLTELITAHFQLLDSKPLFFNKNSNFVLIPVPLEKKKLRWRGFNQAEEIARELSRFLELPLINDVLIKKKTNLAQTNLSEKERIKNVSGIFDCHKQEKIKDKNILLVDDIYTTGATMKESAKTLKKAGVQKITGVVVARAIPGQDKF